MQCHQAAEYKVSYKGGGGAAPAVLVHGYCSSLQLLSFLLCSPNGMHRLLRISVEELILFSLLAIMISPF